MSSKSLAYLVCRRRKRMARRTSREACLVLGAIRNRLDMARLSSCGQLKGVKQQLDGNQQVVTGKSTHLGMMLLVLLEKVDA